MSPRAKGYLYDIIETARLIQQSTNDKNFDDYEADIGLQHQIERELTIIGEALGLFTWGGELRTNAPQVSRWGAGNPN